MIKLAINYKQVNIEELDKLSDDIDKSFRSELDMLADYNVFKKYFLYLDIGLNHYIIDFVNSRLNNKNININMMYYRMLFMRISITETVAFTALLKGRLQ